MVTRIMGSLDDLDAAWESFCYTQDDKGSFVQSTPCLEGDPPKATDIYISTKTKISYLNQGISLSEVFWIIPITPYHEPREGVVKKQMKFNSITPEELEALQMRMNGLNCVDEHIITRIVNPEGRIKFKDVRKVSIGLAKKDIVSYRRKKRGAFYNCFVMIIRVNCTGSFKEIHVKVFNTGKLEIPGIQDAVTLDRVLMLVTQILKPLISGSVPLECLAEKTETVLINSNFSCGYYIDRDKLYNKLRYTYRINSAYDPCSYPGIQCEFYYTPKDTIQTGQQPLVSEDSTSIVKVSFMIFRTGSVLIVGKCSEQILEEIYVFLKRLLAREYCEVGCPGTSSDKLDGSKKQRKVRRKMLILGS